MVIHREWHNLSSLKARLLGLKAFPIRIGLKPPNGRSALLSLDHFQQFVDDWKVFPHQDIVRWTFKNFRDLPNQKIPTTLEIASIQDLVRFLGDDALARSVSWEKTMTPLLQVDRDLYPTLVRHLEILEKLTLRDSELLARLVPQLKPGIGEGQYLRALPLVDIDTKFIEKHQTLIEALVDSIHKGHVSELGGLTAWLGCTTPSRGWLTIRPLCNDSLAALGGIPLLQLPGDFLKGYELPASNILVVENIQSGLALPAMPDTVAVIGGGNNVAWMDASWLSKKRVGYWGDIDTWGFSILSDARSRCAGIESLMMDFETMKSHEERIVPEPEPIRTSPLSLNEEEANLFNYLISGQLQSPRLEQERLSSNYIVIKLTDWLYASHR